MVIRSILAILLLCAGLVVHEMGHAVAMHHAKVDIKEIHIGLGPTLYSRNIVADNDSIHVVFSLLPLGAFVEPTMTRKEMERSVSSFDLFVIHGLGIWSDMAFGFLLLIFSCINKLGDFFKMKINIPIILFLVLGTADLYAQTGFFWEYGMLLSCGIVVVMLIKEFFNKQGSFGSPVGMVSLFKSKVATLSDSVKFAGGLLIGYAIMNLLPVVPLDGGQYILTLLKSSPEAQKMFAAVSFSVFAFLTLFFIFRDIFFPSQPQKVRKKRSR